MKIILFGWNRLGNRWKGNWNHEFFRRELARQHDVVLWGKGYDGYNPKYTVADVIAQNIDVDVLMTHYEHRDNVLTPGLEKVSGIFKVHVMGGDYYRQAKEYDAHLNKVQYNMIFSPTLHTMELLKKHGINSEHYFLPFAVYTGVYYKHYSGKPIDVMVSGQIGNNHPHRVELRDRVSRISGITTFTDAVWFNEYVNTINQSKIFVTSSIQHHIILGKYFEAMACGTLLLATNPREAERCGLREGYHFITYEDDFSDLEDKIRYFLKNDKEREEIAKNGMELTHKMHSTKYRVREFTHAIIER